MQANYMVHVTTTLNGESPETVHAVLANYMVHVTTTLNGESPETVHAVLANYMVHVTTTLNGESPETVHAGQLHGTCAPSVSRNMTERGSPDGSSAIIGWKGGGAEIAQKVRDRSIQTTGCAIQLIAAMHIHSMCWLSLTSSPDFPSFSSLTVRKNL